MARNSGDALQRGRGFASVARMLLPERPLKLKSSFVWKSRLGGVLGIVAGLAMLVGVGWWQSGEVRRLLDEKALWARGVAASGVEVSGRETTNRFLFHSYKLKVAYRDADGRRHGGKVEFDTVVGSIKNGRRASVHYAPEAPERFVLSWALEVERSRWGSMAFFVAVGVVVGGLFVVVGVGALRKLADARHCAVRGEEVVARITKAVQQTNHGKHTSTTYHFEGALADGRIVAGKADFPAKHRPLVLDPEGATMLVLATPAQPKRPVPLRGDCHPYALSGVELATVHRVLDGLRNPAPAER